MTLTKYFSRLRVSSKSNLVKDIRDEMEEIKSRWGESFIDGGEPQVLLNSKTNEVWISCGDWHDKELVRDVFHELEELDGVEGVDGESESFPSGYNYGKGESDWEKVFP